MNGDLARIWVIGKLRERMGVRVWEWIRYRSPVAQNQTIIFDVYRMPS